MFQDIIHMAVDNLLYARSKMERLNSPIKQAKLPKTHRIKHKEQIT